MIGRSWERFSDDDPYMHVERMVNGLVVLSHYERRVEGKVVSARALLGGTFITLNDGIEYPLDGPWMWDIEGYSQGEPEVGNTVKVHRKMTTVIGPVTRVDHPKSGGINIHVQGYPAPMFIGKRHDAWTVEEISL